MLSFVVVVLVTAVVSVVTVLSPLLHAATATSATTIAMRFIESSVRVNESVSAARCPRD
jgi:hypothetical protein